MLRPVRQRSFRCNQERARVRAPGAVLFYTAGMAALRRPSREACLLAVIVLCGCAVRVLSARAEFWLDEIWSWEFSRLAKTPWDIFFVLKHDNNHILNTLMLWLWPAGLPWPLYRAHSIIAGTLAIVAAWRFGGRFGAATGLLTALLIAACPWLVWSSAEARGYALMVLCVFVAADALHRTLSGSTRAAPVFWIASVMGVLAHPTFLHASFGFGLWAWAAALRESTMAHRARSLAWSQGPVLAAFVVLGIVVFSDRMIGGAPATPLASVVARLLAVGIGGPPSPLAGAPWIAASLLGLALGLATLHRRGDPAVWLFIGAAVCMPLFVVLIQRPPFLFERYLFAAWALGAVPMALGIEYAARAAGERWKRPALALIVVAILLGDAYHVARFIRVGRGDFVGAARWMLDHDAGAVVQVAGNLPLRIEKYVRFYAPYLSSSGHTLTYAPPQKTAERAIDWLLIERMEGAPPPGAFMHDNIGNSYKREWFSPARGLGSWNWAVFRKQQAAQP